MEEREEILRARDRADYTTQRINNGDILTGGEFDAIRRDLDAMPDSVRAETAAGDDRTATLALDPGTGPAGTVLLA